MRALFRQIPLLLLALPLWAQNSPPPGPTVFPITQPGQPSAQPDIRDIQPLIFFFHPLFWIEVFLILLVLAGLFYLLWRWFQRTGLLSPKSADQSALEKLEKARALLRVEEPLPYAQAVSDVVRQYVVERFGLGLTRQTTEEALREMEADPDLLDQEQKDLLRYFLEACDQVKFAKYQPSQTELEAVHERAVRFVHATQLRPEKEAVAP